jgi:nitrate reductase alpha subunit
MDARRGPERSKNIPGGEHSMSTIESVLHEHRVFEPSPEWVAQAHLSNGMPPGMLFMYHGWDPMMFRGQHNFSAVVCTAGLIKPTSMAGGYGHLGHRSLAFAPNQTYKDFTVNFEKFTPAPESLG